MPSSGCPRSRSKFPLAELYEGVEFPSRAGDDDNLAAQRGKAKCGASHNLKVVTLAKTAGGRLAAGAFHDSRGLAGAGSTVAPGVALRGHARNMDAVHAYA